MSEQIRLTQFVKGGGCAAKIPPDILEKSLCGLDIPVDGNLLVGLELPDDAGVYRVSDELALVQTLDFFPPMVDDPYDFGMIAAANALSDIYAMGAIPKTAMNIVAFPSKSMDISVLRRILEGGLAKLSEADVVLVGGHSIEDSELKYGLSVTGFIHPGKILRKNGIRDGDVLILTKPVGTGVIATALKGELLESSSRSVRAAISVMTALNRSAAEIISKYEVNSCTDITGFGLLGHLAEMVSGSGCSVTVKASSIPLIDGACEWAEMGVLPAALHSNRASRGKFAYIDADIPLYMQDMLFDPQTSGGLLFSIPENCGVKALEELKANSSPYSSIIGCGVKSEEEKIIVIP